MGKLVSQNHASDANVTPICFVHQKKYLDNVLDAENIVILNLVTGLKAI